MKRWGGAIKPELNLTEIKEQMTSTIDRIDQDQSIQIQRDEFAS